MYFVKKKLLNFVLRKIYTLVWVFAILQKFMNIYDIVDQNNTSC